MIEVPSYDDLPPFDRHAQCQMCGRVQGHAEKPNVLYCAGDLQATGPGGRPADELCPLGGADAHLHRRCTDCGYTWACQLASQVPPLTGAEILTLRKAIAAKA